MSLANRLLAAVFAPFLILLALPLEIYLANEAEMAFHFGALAGPLLTAFLLASLAFYALVTWHGLFGRLLLALAICFWISSSFFNTSYGVFNGGELTVETFSPLAGLEVLIWAAVITTFLFAKGLSRRFWEGSWIVFILSLIVTSGRAYQVFKTEPTVVQNVQQAVSVETMQGDHFSGLPIFSSDRNILHVILDEAQGTIVERVLADNPELAQALTGFYFFADTAGVFPYTQVSLPALFSGEIYNNDYDKQEYFEKAFSQNQFFYYLEEAGYSRRFHVYPVLCWSGYLDNCSGIPGTSTSAVSLNLLDFSLLRVTPIMAAHHLYWHGQGLFSRLIGEIGYLNTMTGIAWLDYTAFNERISADHISPKYKVFHSMLTHTPLVLDGNCELLTKTAAVTLTASSEQTLCALGMVTRMLSKMDEQGVLDNTLIIISSDHGGNHVPKTHRQALKQQQISPRDFSRADALLMVKPFAARGRIAVSKQPVQLSQIGQMIRLLDEESADIHQAARQLARENAVRRFNSLEVKLDENQTDRLPGFRSYCIEGPVTDPTSWSALDLDSQSICQAKER
jgi:hypothetical protein